MKERLITFVLGITLLIIVLLFYKTYALNAAFALVAVLSVYEVFAATKSTKKTGLITICYLFAAVVPFINIYKYGTAAVIICFAFTLAMLVYTLSKHGKIQLSQMSILFLMTLLATSSMACLIYLRDAYSDSGRLINVGLFYIGLAFVGAWVTDVGGYIFGRLLGKHKLSPSISPKKTVEGAVGGIVLSILCSVGLMYGYSAFLSCNGVQARYNYGSVIILSLLCAIVSIVGDLSASLLKRENNIKDFGNILPGHGGMLDRFDSVIFVSPLILIWVGLFPLISR